MNYFDCDMLTISAVENVCGEQAQRQFFFILQFVRSKFCLKERKERKRKFPPYPLLKEIEKKEKKRKQTRMPLATFFELSRRRYDDGPRGHVWNLSSRIVVPSRRNQVSAASENIPMDEKNIPSDKKFFSPDENIFSPDETGVHRKEVINSHCLAYKKKFVLWLVSLQTLTRRYFFNSWIFSNFAV